MDYKLIALGIYSLVFVYNMILNIVAYRSAGNPMPDNVKDIYEEVTYVKWQAYHGEKCRLEIWGTVLSFVINFILLAVDFYAFFGNMAGSNVYLQTIVVLAVFVLVDTVVGTVANYIDTMIIEQKYGFNNTTIKTFVVDRVKELLITMVLMIGLMCLFTLIHQSMGDWILILFSIILVVILGLVMFLYPLLTKIFNKFTPLEDGELKTKLTALLEKYGYKVKTIDVMLASELTTKSNAYFSGFGKMKTIVLYDNLINSMTTDEICAVFAHEMGHGLHKDTIKNNIMSVLMVVTLVLLAWLTVRYPEIYTAFGFNSVNYGFALILILMVEFALVSPVFGLITSAISRRAEYRADAVAVKEGYGPALISGLKKLSKENFSNLAPSKMLVVLSYSHPPMSERLAAIEKGR